MDNGRRTFITLSLMAPFCLPSMARAAEGSDTIIQSIKSRRSVRAYTAEPVSAADIRTILECGMLAPSAANEQPWEFVVIQDKKLLAQVGEINHYAAFARHAPLAILACLNEKKEKIKGMGILDMAIACENMLLAAHALGLGGVFTGIYPDKERMEGFRKLTSLPDYVLPISLLVFGHPEIQTTRIPDRFNPQAIHQDKWSGQ